MLTFYPGPSKVYPKVADYLKDAMNEGILSQNHRSQAFMQMLQQCLEIFKQKLEIPNTYEVFFTSSATECWEIIGQSLIHRASHHYYNGAFGQKWFEYTSRLNFKKSTSTNFDFQEPLALQNFHPDADLVCFTQNETSNATQIDTYSIKNQTNTLIAFDVTSSLGGIKLNWATGDIWLASSQKCLGLPAGLGILICSPKAMLRASEINDRNYYNSLLFVADNFRKFQTHYTPNTLAIYLLMRTMKDIEGIEEIDKKTKKRAIDFYNFIEQETSLKLLVKKPTVRSDTVIAIESSADAITKIKKLASQQQITLGNGYGKWQDSTFRIANFPALEDYEFDKLKNLLKL